MNIAQTLLSKEFNEGVFNHTSCSARVKGTHLPTNNENGTENIITLYLKADWVGELGNSNHIDGVRGNESFEIKGGKTISSIHLNSTPLTKYTPFEAFPTDAKIKLSDKGYPDDYLFPKSNIFVLRDNNGKVKNVISYDPSLDPLCYNTRKDYENEEAYKKESNAESIDALSTLASDPEIAKLFQDKYPELYEKEMLKIEKRLKGENYSDYFKQDGGKFTLKNTHPHSFVSLRQRNMFNYEFKKSLDRINVNINELLDTLSSIVIISNSRYLEFELDKTDVYVFFENDKLKILGYKKETSI